MVINFSLCQKFTWVSSWLYLKVLNKGENILLVMNNLAYWAVTILTLKGCFITPTPRCPGASIMKLLTIVIKMQFCKLLDSTMLFTFTLVRYLRDKWERIRVEPLMWLRSKGRLLPLLVNIRIEWFWVAVTNTPTYCSYNCYSFSPYSKVWRLDPTWDNILAAI
jgi:hypothetical protein